MKTPGHLWMKKGLADYNDKGSPYVRSSFVSRLFFWWVSPLLDVGWKKKQLEQSDLYPTIPEAEVSLLHRQFCTAWDSEIAATKEPSLWRVLFKLCKRNLLDIILAQSGETFFKITGFLLTSRFLDKFAENDTSYWYDVLLGAIFLVFNSLCHAQVQYNGMKFGMKVRVMMNSVIYDKLLSLTISNDSAAGQIVNMISNDVQKLEEFAPFVHFLLFGPIESIVTFVAVLLLTGSWVTVLLVIGFVVLITIIFMLLSIKVSSIRKNMVLSRDDMIRSVTDMLTGMQVIKYYAWESPFHQRIIAIRDKVTKYLKKSGDLKAYGYVIYLSANSLIIVLMLSILHFSGLQIDTNIVVIDSIFATVVLVVCCLFPKAIEMLSESKISVSRIQAFLLKEQISKNQSNDSTIVNQEDLSVGVRMIDASFKWPSSPVQSGKKSTSICKETLDKFEEDQSSLALHGINLTVKKGELTVVVGPVGCGKTALLNGILGEISLHSGQMFHLSPIAYCSQFPWLVSTSIRDNILMGKEYNSEFYASIIDACDLKKDFERLPDGDLTHVGERGSTLSGGQKARISLARALYYRDANLFLLDDVLSAVDNVVGALLFNSIKDILKEKCCILVTHQLQFVRSCEQVVLMGEGGEMKFCGSYSDLKATKLEFVQVLNAYDSLKESPLEDVPINSYLTDNISSADDCIVASPISIIASSEEKKQKQKRKRKHNQNLSSLESITSEEIQTNSVGLNVYLDFFRNDGSLFPIIMLIICAIASHLVMTVFVYVSYEWSIDILNKEYGLATVFCCLVDVILFCLFFFFFYRKCLNASKKMFNKMIKKIIRSPLHFFQSNPQGRIINRFSRDQAMVDEVICSNMIEALHCTILDIICLVFICIYNPYAIALMPLLIFCVLHISKKFFKASRDIKRLEAASRSPVYSQLSSTLEGLPLIRCFGVESYFLDKFFFLQNANTQCLFAYIGVSKWFAFYIDMSCSTFYTCFVLLSIYLGKGTIDVDSISKAIGYCQKMSEMITWTGKMIADLENNKISIERIMSYTTLESEADEECEEDKLLPVDWPECGSVTYKNVSFQYPSRNSYALHNVSCSLEPGEKIGIVGRTGAGKSSFLSALFRIVELKKEKSQSSSVSTNDKSDSMGIFIDGVDISTIGLKTLRRKISIIPQEPFLFRGDVRFNLDPFNEHSDVSLWEALHSVQLAEKINGMSDGLSSLVLENGTNFSTGQKQLVCLARAILRRNKIIVMDEATANIDLPTSLIIQDTIRKLFNKCNVCTVAHRLHTIIDYDKIIVLDVGEVAETGSPHELLSTNNGITKNKANIKRGIFAKMVKELGEDGEAHLKRVAQESYLSRRRVTSNA